MWRYPTFSRHFSSNKQTKTDLPGIPWARNRRPLGDDRMSLKRCHKDVPMAVTSRTKITCWLKRPQNRLVNMWMMTRMTMMKMKIKMTMKKKKKMMMIDDWRLNIEDWNLKTDDSWLMTDDDDDDDDQYSSASRPVYLFAENVLLPTNY